MGGDGDGDGDGDGGEDGDENGDADETGAGDADAGNTSTGDADTDDQSGVMAGTVPKVASLPNTGGPFSSPSAPALVVGGASLIRLRH